MMDPAHRPRSGDRRLRHARPGNQKGLQAWRSRGAIGARGAAAIEVVAKGRAKPSSGMSTRGRGNDEKFVV